MRGSKSVVPTPHPQGYLNVLSSSPTIPDHVPWERRVLKENRLCGWQAPPLMLILWHLVRQKELDFAASHALQR